MLYTYTPFPYRPPPELSGGPATDAPVAIVGAGPIGLSIAIDLAQRGIASTLLDDNNVVSVGSRAICWAKHTLEIFGRLGVGERMLEKGVTWQVGRLFHGGDEVYSFDLLPEPGHKYPAFINLQQYYVEQYLVERAQEFPDLIDLRFKNRVTDHEAMGDGVRLAVDTPDGPYTLDARYLLACDGANSPTRSRMELSFEGESFDENFLIVDVEMKESPFPGQAAERWFWFDPPFHDGQSALLHKQPDNIYRIDLQLGPDTDPEAEATEARVLPRIRAVVGDTPFTLDWMSVYRFRCARLARFVHGPVIFLGDSAHVVSPFGARGGNGGIHDVDNLGWKLAAVLKGEAPGALLDTYDSERVHGAEENILNSARATNFMTPKSPVEALFRTEVLSLAHEHDFARKLINSGRLSTPCALASSPLTGEGGGQPVLDAPLERDGTRTWLIEEIGREFTLVSIDAPDAGAPPGLRHLHVTGTNRPGALHDREGLAAARCGTGRSLLVRPDGYVAAAFEEAAPGRVADALAVARGQALKEVS